MLCEFQVYSTLFQLYTCIYSFFFRFFSDIGYHRILSRVPCAVLLWGFPDGSDGKHTICKAGDLGLIPGLGRSPGGGLWQPTPVFLPGKSLDRGAWRWGCKESDMTE